MENMLPPPEPKPLPVPQSEQSCPRCNSTSTKFCYYNNYSLSQPRYFCKSCRRYWTKGGTLRNVPVGGGCRKKQKNSSRRTAHADAQFASVSDTRSPNLLNFGFGPVNLGLNFSGFQKLPDVELLPVLENYGSFQNSSLGWCQVLDSLSSGNFFETSNSFGSSGKSRINHCEDNGGGGSVGIVGDYADSAAEMAVGDKAETVPGNLEKEGRVLWGFPWQDGSDRGIGSRSDRGSWTEFSPSTWNGLINNHLL